MHGHSYVCRQVRRRGSVPGPPRAPGRRPDRWAAGLALAALLAWAVAVAVAAG